MLQDVPSYQITPLELVVEFFYHCSTVDRILPRLRLLRLKRLGVPYPLQAHRANTSRSFPNAGHVLLAEAIAMSYFSDLHSHSVRLSGEETDVSLSVMDFQGGAVPLGWFSEETSIPSGRI